nr:RsmE family RNA methyltransferase [Lacticaseibacillus thailandensis]
MQRYFTDATLTVGAHATLNSTVEHHAVTVLRMQVDDQLEVADAQGHAFVTTITKTAPLTVRVERPIPQSHELPVAVTIVCGISKGQKAELIVQKATELGVRQVIFVNTQWATARWLPDRAAKKVARLQQVAQSAAEQSHRDRVPQVSFVPLLDAVLHMEQMPRWWRTRSPPKLVNMRS